MRKALAIIFFFLFCLPVKAQICNTVPFTFVNGTTIDATQMNANFAALVTCINDNAANAGANTNITSLTALSPNTLVPSGVIAWFNSATCPASWNVANGSNGTTDVRGYFIRAQNNGATIDPYNPSLGQTIVAHNGAISGASAGSTSGYTTGALSASVNGTLYSNQSNVLVGVASGSVALASGGYAFPIEQQVSVSGTLSGYATGNLTVTGSGSGWAFSCSNCGTESNPHYISLTACQKS